MILAYQTLLASFTVPYEVCNDATSLLWLLPLLAAVAIVYKTLKLPAVTVEKFIREVVILFGTILLFMALIAIALYIIGRLIIG